MIFKTLKYIVMFIPVLISTVISFFSVFSASAENLEADIAQQIERISSLEQSYKNGKIAGVDEASFFAGDLEKELENGMKFNEISCIATHNSYQNPSTDETKKLYKNLSSLTFGLVAENLSDFWSENLTDQLNCGIRSFEIDIETFDRDGEISFTCMHSPHFEMSTSCYDFSLALKEIAMWSDNNPNHLPITIIIEPKKAFLPLKDMKLFNIDYARKLDSVLRERLGDNLFTPADMLRDYESFGEMREADDWCKVNDMLGKVLVLFHEGSVTKKYIKIDPSIKTQAMFPMLRPEDSDKDYASFILCNKPKELVEVNDEFIIEKKLIVRTRADSFSNISEEKLEQAMSSDAQIISTDYPVRTDSTAESYIVAFEGRKTIRKIG